MSDSQEKLGTDYPDEIITDNGAIIVMNTEEKEKPKTKAVGFSKGDKNINRTKPGPGRTPAAIRMEYAQFCTPKKARNLLYRIKKSKDLKLESDFFFKMMNRAHGKPIQPIEQRGTGPMDEWSDEFTLMVLDTVANEVEQRKLVNMKDISSEVEGMVEGVKKDED